MPIPGKEGELGHLVTAAELVLVDWGYQLDRTEPPYDATRGVQVYAVFVRPGEHDDGPTTSWLT